jgi:hypothetical protein
LWAFELHWPILAIIRPKSQISNVLHDGTLSIRIFLLMWKNSKILILRPLEANGHWPILVIIQHPAKVPNFFHRAWLYFVEQKFHTEDEKTQESWIWARAPKKCAPGFRGTWNFLFIIHIFVLVVMILNFKAAAFEKAAANFYSGFWTPK